MKRWMRKAIIVLAVLSLVLCSCGETAKDGQNSPMPTLAAVESESVPEPSVETPVPKIEPADAVVALSPEELAQINAKLELTSPWVDEPGLNPLCLFFTSFYESPEYLDLEDFLRYFPLSESGGEEEFQALKMYDDWPFSKLGSLEEMPVPLHRRPAAEVERLLKKYTGIGLADLKGISGPGVYYLEQYDAFYNYTSDFGLMSFQAQYGERQGDVLSLVHLRWDGVEAQLRLRQQGDSFIVLSYLPLETEGE